MVKLVLLGILFSLSASAIELRIKVAVIDSGIDTKFPTKSLCESGPIGVGGLGAVDHVGHGTKISRVVMVGIDDSKVCLQMIKDGDRSGTLDMSVRAFQIAAAQNAKYVNWSREAFSPSPELDKIVTTLTNRYVHVSVAAGNSGFNLNLFCNITLACHATHSPWFSVVGALDSAGKRMSYSNYGAVVTSWEAIEPPLPGLSPLGGTSEATARHTNRIMKQDGLGK